MYRPSQFAELKQRTTSSGTEAGKTLEGYSRLQSLGSPSEPRPANGSVHPLEILESGNPADSIS